MRITFDKEADAMYIYLKSKVFKTKNVTDDTLIWTRMEMSSK